jgi:hypothetical protein
MQMVATGKPLDLAITVLFSAALNDYYRDIAEVEQNGRTKKDVPRGAAVARVGTRKEDP